MITKFKILIKILAYFNACNHTNNIGGRKQNN